MDQCVLVFCSVDFWVLGGSAFMHFCCGEMVIFVDQCVLVFCSLELFWGLGGSAFMHFCCGEMVNLWINGYLYFVR